MNNLDKAREWAEDGKGLYSPGSRAKAVTDIILSLPDQWVDAEEVRKVTDRHNDLIVDFLDQIEGDMHADTWEAIRDFMCELNVEVDTLAIPKLPTLADLIEQGHDVDDYLFTWVDTEDGLQLVTMTGDFDDRTIYTTDNRGYRLGKSWEEVTPRPDLPNLQWPAQEPRNPETTPAETLNNTSSDTPRNPRPEECCGKCPETVDGGWDCTCEDNPRCSKNTPNPEDVPHNEPWLIEVDGEKAIGARYAGDSAWPWTVAALNGLYAGDYSDNAVTLIHKLVPEPPALPEGMRLADHEKFGRVVTSPWGDGDDDYKIFFLNEDARGGADYEYANESTLTFLGGADNG